MPLRQNRTFRRQVYKTGTIFSVGPTAVRYLILLLLGALSFFYLAGSTQATQISADIRSEDSLQADQHQQLTTLGIQAGRLQSIQTMNETATKAGLVPIGNPATLTVTPTN